MVKLVLLLAALVSGAAAADTDLWKEVSVKYAPNGDDADVSAFFRLHNTLDEALASGWVQVHINNRLNLRAVALTAEDFGVNPLYDNNGFIAGVHVAQPVQTVWATKAPIYNPLANSANEILTIDGILHLASTFLLVDPVVLAAGGRTELGNLGQGVWVRDTTVSSGFRRFPIDIAELRATTLFKWQNCIPAMGIHDYYNMELNVGDCSDLYPWFVLSQNGVTSGVGWQIHSQPTIHTRNWYDIVNSAAVAATIPLAPPCVSSFVDVYGVTSLHFYFHENPWELTCNQATDSVVPIGGM